MAIKTTAEQLEEVQTAISALLSGAKSVSVDGGFTYTHENLDALTRREEILLSRYGAQNGQRPRVSVGTFDGAAAQ